VPISGSLYRTDDYGHTWHPVPLPEPQYSGDGESSQSFMADGTLVRELSPKDGSALRFWLLHDGASAWQPVTNHGLAAAAQAHFLEPDGTFLAYGFTNNSSFDLYRSADLSTWTHLTLN